MIAQQTIPLFDGRRLDLRQARGVIVALSGADVIREWQALTASRCNMIVLPRCYAVIMVQGPGAYGGRQRLIGRGLTPAAAIEDLLWQVVTPRLLSE